MNARAIDRVIGRAIDRVGDRAIDRVIDRAIDRVIDRAIDRVIDRAIDRVIDRALDRVIGRAIDRVIDRVMASKRVLQLYSISAKSSMRCPRCAGRPCALTAGKAPALPRRTKDRRQDNPVYHPKIHMQRRT